MFRVVLTQLLLFLLPFLCYFLWLRLQSRPDGWGKGPVAWLSIAGIILVIASMAVFANLKQRPEGTEYRPSVMQDGVFVPGHYE